MTKKELIHDMVRRARFNSDCARRGKNYESESPAIFAAAEYYRGKKDAYMMAARRIKGIG